MKKFLVIAVALILVVCTFAACSGKTDVDLSSLLTDINSAHGITDLKILESTSDLNRYYSIAEEDVKQFAAELTTKASQYNEVIIVEAVDAAAADRVATQLNNHLDTQLNTAKSYDKDAVAMIEACSVKQSNNIVYLVISEQSAEITKTIEDAI